MIGLGNFENYMPYLAALSAFGGVVTIWWFSLERESPLKRKAKALKEREKSLRGEFGSPSKRSKVLKVESKNLIRNVVTKLNLMKGEHADRIENRLAQAGIRGKESLMVFLFIKLCMPFVGAAVALFLLYINSDSAHSTQTKLLMVSAAVVVGYYVPEIFLKNRVTKRKLALGLSLPDSLDLMVICAEAGLSLDATLKRVANEMALAAPELSEELMLCATELGILPERRKALENLISRTDMPQIKSVVNTLLQAERYGTPLAQSLAILGEEYRSERMMKAEEKAAKLPAILTVPMIVFIMPSLFIVLLGPAIMRGLDSVSQM
ncbi:MAG: type II secretion system F family protein [Alphaproteobacteria bacterium]|nr:type II secretion system F family protein [Alphaproteobacteria bacterium]